MPSNTKRPGVKASVAGPSAARVKQDRMARLEAELRDCRALLQRDPGCAPPGPAAHDPSRHDVTGNAMLSTQTRCQAAALRAEVAERQRAEERFRKREHELETLVEHSPDIIMRFDRAFRHLYVSRAVRRIVDRDPRDWIGKTCREFGFPEPMCHYWESTMDRVFRTGRPDRDEYPYDASGRRVTIEWRLVPEFGSDGAVETVLCVFRDITEQRVAEAARRKAEQELAAQQLLTMRSDRLRSLGEMAAGIAHELNQPLAGVRALAEQNLIALQRKWPLPPLELQRELQMIVDQTDRMEHIINHVRMFARDAGKPETQCADLNEIIESSVGLVRDQIRAAGIAIVTDRTQPLPGVDVNAFSMEEVFLNLIRNAQQAIQEVHLVTGGRIVLNSQVCEAGGRRWVCVAVSDNGCGIQADILDRIFDPFFTTKAPDQGSGLGLPVSRSIVEAFGGTLRIESEPGQGATARIRLPVAAESPPTAPPGAPAGRPDEAQARPGGAETAYPPQ